MCSVAGRIRTFQLTSRTGNFADGRIIMKIACLQFAPQVGDIDNNLNRADSVLAKANPDDLEGLDLLVLPELAFTGATSVQADCHVFAL